MENTAVLFNIRKLEKTGGRMNLGRKTKNPVLNVLLLRCSCLQVSIQFLDSNRFLKINFKFCNQLLSAGIEGPPNI